MFVHWSIPEKIETGVEDILFWEGSLEFFDSSLYPSDKMKLHPCKFHKIVLHPLKFPMPHTKTQWKFPMSFYDAWKFHFFFNWPLELLYSIFSIPLKTLALNLCMYVTSKNYCTVHGKCFSRNSSNSNALKSSYGEWIGKPQRLKTWRKNSIYVLAFYTST